MGHGFDALDVRRIQSIDRFLILALPAQGDQFLADLHGRHAAFSFAQYPNVVMAYPF
jgi:hypothetical protein